MARKNAVSITSAAQAHSDDLIGRERRYLLSMGIRTVCFFACVFIDHPVRWVFLAGAVFLPYFAVVLANAGVRRKSESAELLDPKDRKQITDGDDE